jgi:hypothetical protein
VRSEQVEPVARGAPKSARLERAGEAVTSARWMPPSSPKLIEQLYPTVPKIELNRRDPARLGWDAWGAEAED